MKKVKFAVVGAGHIGKRHAEMVTRNENAELVALVDIKSADTLGIDKYGVPFFNSIDELIAKGPDFDVLCIATPNGLHAQHAMAGLTARKHIVVEKPMALTKSDCEAIIYKAMALHKHVFCVMQNRYSPPSIWIKDIVDPKSRAWEEFYRNRNQCDKVVRSTHGVNCTGGCSWNIHVKDGIVTWEMQALDYPELTPDMPGYEPRGCQRGISYSWYLYSPLRVK